MELCQHPPVEIGVATLDNGVDELLSHIRRIVRGIVRERLSEEMTQHDEPDPRHDVVGVARAANTVFIRASHGLLAVQMVRVVAEHLLFRHLHGAAERLPFFVQQRRNFWVESVDAAFDVVRIVLPGRVDEGFAEEDDGADACGKVQPAERRCGYRAVHVLACGEEGGFDWFRDDVHLELNVSLGIAAISGIEKTHAAQILCHIDQGRDF